MMRKQHLLALTVLVMGSCNSSKNKEIEGAPKTDTIQTQLNQSEQQRLLNRMRVEETAKEDSIKLSMVLGKALEVAYQSMDRDEFNKEFDIEFDSLYIVTVKMNFGKFFPSKHRYLIIHRHSPPSVFVDIYIRKDKKLEAVLSHEQWSMTYVTDTIMDVNGDGYKDFLVNWYGATGCCLKNFYNVYLFNPESGGFSDDFEFINPTFSSKEKVIR